MQRVRLELYRDNLLGALEMLANTLESAPDTAYHAEMARLRKWRAPLSTREGYAAAYEKFPGPMFESPAGSTASPMLSSTKD
jgi:hypothetical protein